MGKGVELMGRRPETALLEQVLADAAAGPGGGSATLLRGEAGIGKSALLEWTARRARERGFSVLRAVGTQAEQGVAFGALHRVLAPLAPHTDALPVRQRAALGLARTPPDPAAAAGPGGGLLVGGAALSLLAEATRVRPLLVLVDDVQWVDPSSAAVFAFLHRRIGELPLAMVGAGRPDGTTADSRTVPVGALARPDAARLLRRRHPGLAAPTAERVLREAAGNPLALVELPNRLAPAQMAGTEPLPEDRLPLGGPLERLFTRRLDALPPASHRLLLLAALGGDAASWHLGEWLRGTPATPATPGGAGGDGAGGANPRAGRGTAAAGEGTAAAGEVGAGTTTAAAGETGPDTTTPAAGETDTDTTTPAMDGPETGTATGFPGGLAAGTTAPAPRDPAVGVLPGASGAGPATGAPAPPGAGVAVAFPGASAAGSPGGSGRVRAEAVLDAIEDAGVARLDSSGRLVFRHPLVRSAVIERATAEERRAAHRELAAALPPADPRRPTHEAAAADGPDEALAARLQSAGDRLARRGGDAEAALLLHRAAALSTGPGARARRLARAAVASARGGRLPCAAGMVEELRRLPVPADAAPLVAYATVYVDQSHHVDFESSFTLLPAALDTLTRSGAPGGLAEQVYFKLLLATAYTNDPRGVRALERYAERMSPTARLCWRAWADPARTAHGVTAELSEALARTGGDEHGGAAWLLLWAALAVDRADAVPWRRFAGQHTYATQGTIAKARCYQDFLRGRWDQAEVCPREAHAAEALGYHGNALLFRLYHAHYLAGRGDEEGLREAERAVRPVAERARMTFVTDRLTHLRALAALAHERYEEAYGTLAGLTPPGVLPAGLAWFHLPFFDFVVAATRTGRHAEARAHLAAARAARMAELSPHHAFLLAAATAVAETDAPDDALYRAAYAVPGAGEWVFGAARLRLAHGTWLRRRQRPGAREALGQAHRAFRALRATPWALRAAAELRAAGHPVAAGAAAGGGVRERLTAQELRIAELAADGLTNKDIGDRLRVSPRTVADHLYKAFPKLGITSRAALTRALAEAGAPRGVRT
ncbi:AAA family ATPase [Streptomyces sp. NPDC093252]|uniref:helix-turn-helix transcriptional regulator n=1 Tax=Streptomyces sp. NPDC093252 TaxID=3154980 RepID=UPI003423C07F